MKITVNTKIFKDLLKLLLKTKNVRRALNEDTCAVTAEKDSVTLRVINGAEAMLCIRIPATGENAPASVEETGSINPLLAQLIQMTDQISDERFTLESKEFAGEPALHISWYNGNSRLPLINNINEDESIFNLDKEEESSCVVVAADFSDLVSDVAYATAQNDIHPVFSMICIDMTDAATATAFGSDGKKLALRTKSVDDSLHRGILIPTSYAGILKKVLESDEKATLTNDNRYTVVECGIMTLHVTHPKMKYVDARRVIPHNNPIAVTMSRNDILSCIKTAGVLTSITQNALIVTITPTITGADVEFRGEDANFKQSSRQTLAATTETPLEEPLQISFNTEHLHDIVTNIQGETLTLRFSDSKQAVLFVDEDGNERAILMPIVY